MPIVFTCPHCQTQTEVEDRYSGRAGDCVVCGGAIELPTFSTSSTRHPAAAGGHRTVAKVIAGGLLLTGLIIGSVAAFRYGGTAITQIRGGQVQAASKANLQKIAAALNNYAADYGRYPPPYTTDASGVPLHSWRVLILPYLGEDELYASIDLQRHWNKTQDAGAYPQSMPAVYRHPGGGGWTNHSNYYLITGMGTLFPPTGPLDPTRVADEPDKTILLVESDFYPPSGNWLEPVDLNIDDVLNATGNGGRQTLGMTDAGGACVATVDGKARYLIDTTSSGLLSALLSPAGGEPLADDVLE